MGTTLTMNLFVESDPSGPAFPASPSDNAHFFSFWNGDVRVFAGCDFDLVSNVWHRASCTIPVPEFTDVALVFRVFPSWRGTVYVDDVALQ